jgi:hypothetical protein
MKILLLCSSFNGLIQRIWTELRADGHEVTTATADSDDVVRAAVSAADPDLMLCPFLGQRRPRIKLPAVTVLGDRVADVPESLESLAHAGDTRADDERGYHEISYERHGRVGAHEAVRLTEDCLPIGATEALRSGLADAVLPADPVAFDAAVLEHAQRLATEDHIGERLARKAEARAADELRRPLETYRIRELAEMSRDIFDDRAGFAAARHAFVTKRPAPAVTVPAQRRRVGDLVAERAG